MKKTIIRIIAAAVLLYWLACVVDLFMPALRSDYPDVGKLLPPEGIAFYLAACFILMAGITILSLIWWVFDKFIMK